MLCHNNYLNLKELENQLEEKKSNQKQAPLPPSQSAKLSDDSPVSSRASSAGYGTISTGSEDDGDDVVVALYDYDGQCGESSIAMIAGELFIREGEDEDGWTKVRRKNITENRCQGFVPTSYLSLVKSNHN